MISVYEILFPLRSHTHAHWQTHTRTLADTHTRTQTFYYVVSITKMRSTKPRVFSLSEMLKNVSTKCVKNLRTSHVNMAV